MSSGPGQVVVVGRAQEAEAVGQHLEHAFREDEAALLGARLQDLEDQLLLAHAGRARHVELLGDLRQRADAHVLERREIDALYLFGGCSALVVFASAVGPLPLPLPAAAARLLGLLLLGRGLFARLSISFHSSSNPSPVTAETGSTESSNTDSSCLSARIRSPRASLSIFVATTAGRSTVRLQPVPGLPVARRGPDAARRPAGARPTSGASDGRRRSLVECRLGRPADSSNPAFPPRIAVPRQVDHVERRGAPARDAVDVRQPRLAGAPLVRATRCRTSALIRLDLPTFERPTSAISASPSRGRSLALAALRRKLASMFTGLDGWTAGRAGCVPVLPRPAYPACPAFMSQWVIVSSTTALSTGSACASAGRRPASGSVSAIFRTSSIVWTM